MAKDINKSKAATAKDNSKAQKSSDNANTDRRILVHAQYIKDLSFENPNAPRVLMEGSTQPDVEISVNVSCRHLDVGHAGLGGDALDWLLLRDTAGLRRVRPRLWTAVPIVFSFFFWPSLWLCAVSSLCLY